LLTPEAIAAGKEGRCAGSRDDRQLLGEKTGTGQGNLEEKTTLYLERSLLTQQKKDIKGERPKLSLYGGGLRSSVGNKPDRGKTRLPSKREKGS